MSLIILEGRLAAPFVPFYSSINLVQILIKYLLVEYPVNSFNISNISNIYILMCYKLYANFLPF